MSSPDRYSTSHASSHLSDTNPKTAATLQDGFEELDRDGPTPSSASSPPPTEKPPSDDIQYARIGAPYAACPLVTPNLHLPVPTAIHHFFPDKIEPQEVKPYPFRQRAPLNGRLERKLISPSSSSYQLLQNPNTYQDDQTPFKKRHSLGNGQIDRLVQGSRHHVHHDALEDRIHWLTRGYYVVHSEQDNKESLSD